MRFFEIPGSGGVPLSAQCPELAGEFPDRSACFYYDGLRNVAQVLRRTLDDEEGREKVRSNARSLVTTSHLYLHRAQQILESLYGTDGK